MIRFVSCTVLAALLLCTPALADTSASYTILYTIALQDNGSALWTVEYRTPLATQTERASFEETINATPEFSGESIRSLMQSSAEQASAATGRPMEIRDFASSVSVQSSPTGTYGVVRYTFLWTNFADADDGNLVMGDAFAGGLYLPAGASLVVQVPEGYSVVSAQPASDSSQGSIVWYGPESFGTGEPRVTLAKTGVPALLVTGGIIVIIAAAGALAFIMLRKKRAGKKGDPAAGPVPGTPLPGNKEPDVPTSSLPFSLTEPDLRNVEERVLHLLEEKGGELYQSDIVQQLALPKSTVSSALNGLHARGMIVKVKKGRENLIRLVK